MNIEKRLVPKGVVYGSEEVAGELTGKSYWSETRRRR